MKFSVVRGDELHDHWFLWLEAETESEAWAGNRAIDMITKPYARFRQMTRVSCPIFCSEHGDNCPGSYGWEMWILSMSNPEGEKVLNSLIPTIQAKAEELLKSW